MYPAKKYQERLLEDIYADLEEVKSYLQDTRRVFLCDGNALRRDTDDLIRILEKIETTFPLLQRVGIYANAQDILGKSNQDLQVLKQHKLAIGYLGLESGNEEVLVNVKKGSTAREMADAVKKAQANGIKMSVIYLLGLGGKSLWRQHALDSAKTVNEMQPVYLSALTLMLIPGTALHKKYEKGEFQLPDQRGYLEELYTLIEHLDLKGTVFRSNHASNYLALSGRFPKDREMMLVTIKYALDGGDEILRPEYLRGL